MSGVAGLAMLIFLSFGGEDTLDPFDRPIGTDFSAFWHAGRMAAMPLARGTLARSMRKSGRPMPVPILRRLGSIRPYSC